MKKKDLLKVASKDEVKRVELKFHSRSVTRIQLLDGSIKRIEKKDNDFTLF